MCSKKWANPGKSSGLFLLPTFTDILAPENSQSGS